MRKCFFVTATLIAVALGSLLMLAFNQFQLYGRHEKIISQTEKFIFQYSIIREAIIEGVVSGKLDELDELSASVESLHGNVIKILDNSLIPAEYKFSFLQQIDLPGLVLLLRKAASEEENKNILQILNQETRVIGERFILFERLVLGYAKQKLVDFQLVIIGILALVVFLVSILMVITYRLLIMPVINLANQTDMVLSGRQEKVYNPGGWLEVSRLSDKMGELLDVSKNRQVQSERYVRILRCCHQVLQKIQDSQQDVEKLYKTVCRSLLANQDYIMAWIGIEDPEEKGILPVAADGSTTMSCDECNGCFAALLAEQDGSNDPSLKALQTGETVIMKDILSAAPKGPFKNTPLAEGVVDSISLPIIFENEKIGVLTVYVMVQGGFLDSEIELLEELTTVLAAKLHSMGLQDNLSFRSAARNLIGEKNNIITFSLDKSGNILDMDAFLSGSLDKEWVGLHITDVVYPENESERFVLDNSISEEIRYDFNVKIAGIDEKYSAILAPIKGLSVDGIAFILVLLPPPENILIQPENFQVAYSAAIGQFASSIAHEITDLSNGIINYAQMLSDEIIDEAEVEKKNFLSKIITGGEKVAAVVEPLVIDQDDFEFSKCIENINKIFDDVLVLIGHLFKRDCIIVNLDIPSTSLQYNKQHLQLILLIVLKRLRESLNERYPQKDPDKLLDISVVQSTDHAQNMLMITILFTGREADYDERTIEKGQLAGMWLSQELARNLGGEMKFSVNENKKIQIDILLPT